MEIDTEVFASPDTDEPDPSDLHSPLYNKSYQAFIRTILNVNPRIEKVDLPDRVEGMMYADWHSRLVNPFLPFFTNPPSLR